MDGDATGFKGELDTGLVLSGYAMKMPPTFLCSCPQIRAVLSLSQRHSFLQQDMTSAETHY